MIKLIVCDMDGTLLTSEDKISPKTLEYLVNIQEQGVKLVLASGRSYSRLEQYYKELRMIENDGILIEVNGLYVNYLKENKRFKAESIKRQDIERIYSEAKEFDPEIVAYLDKGIRYYIPESMIEIKQQFIKEKGLGPDFPLVGAPFAWCADTRGGYPDQKRMYSVDEFPLEVNKFTLINYPEKTQKMIDKFKDNIFNEYEMSRSAPRALEITAKNVTKGVALRKLMKQLGINRDEVLVFGDGENDYPLFDEVKYSIAMANAPTYVKERAFAITSSNNEDGIYEACKKYIG